MAHDKLDVNHTPHMERLGQTAGILLNRGLRLLTDGLGRIDGDAVPGMDTGPLDMLHDPGDQDILAVAYRVHLDLLAHNVLVHQNRMLLGIPVDNTDVLHHVLIADSDLHSLATQHIRGPH